MRSIVCSPTAEELIEVSASRSPGPSGLQTDSRARSDRIRAAITCAGFAFPAVSIDVTMVPTRHPNPSCDLAVALCVLLSDPQHVNLRRSGMTAWGELSADGSLTAAKEPLVNDLPPGPCVGQIWHPDDHLPSASEDAIVTVAVVTDLHEAWDALELFASMEDEVFARQGLR